MLTEIKFSFEAGDESFRSFVSALQSLLGGSNIVAATGSYTVNYADAIAKDPGLRKQFCEILNDYSDRNIAVKVNGQSMTIEDLIEMACEGM